MLKALNQSHNKQRKVINLGLARIKEFLRYINNPQDSFKSVIIGGTNGKGSVTFYLSNLACKYSNYKVGRFISPHLVKVNERFTINEKEISDVKLLKLRNHILKKVRIFERNNPKHGRLTEFEVQTCLAFYYFNKENIDLAFLEVGLGGRLDAVNVVNSKNTVCSIITNISFDHMNYLGNTLEKIAYEKAGIIKERNIIITSSKGTALNIIKKTAKKLNSKLYIAKTFENENYKSKNIKTALKGWDVICSKLKIKSNTRAKAFLKKIDLNGRFQYLEKEKIVLDSAHNPAGAAELKLRLNNRFKGKEKVYILGFLDKDYKGFINRLIEKNATVICTMPKSSRSTPAKTIFNYSKRRSLNVILEKDLKKSINKAMGLKKDLIVITGSLYLVGEAIALLRKKPYDN